MNRGVARAGLGKHDEALEDCDKALELLAGDANLCAEIHFNKGSIHDEKREFEAAVAAYDTAIEVRLCVWGRGCACVFMRARMSCPSACLVGGFNLGGRVTPR